MGITDSAQIHKIIDARYKSKRKYYDQFYGQITVIQDKKQHMSLALIQKTIISLDKSTSKFINNRKINNANYLVEIIQYYECSTDFCSGLQKYFFLIQYNPHTLYDQICVRAQNIKKFTSKQLFSIFLNYIEIVQYMQNCGKPFTFMISNKNILYYSIKKMKSLQSLFKLEHDTFQSDFSDFNFQKKRQNVSKYLYFSPESFNEILQKDPFKAKQLCSQEKSIVFMLGINFLQIILLADISEVYMWDKQKIDFFMLKNVVKRVLASYGQQLHDLISQMINQDKNARPQLQIVKDYIKMKDRMKKSAFSNFETRNQTVFHNQQIY